MPTFIKLSPEFLTTRLSELIHKPGDSFFDPRGRSGSMIRNDLNQLCADLIQASFPDLDDAVYNRARIVADLRAIALGGPGYKLKPRRESDYTEPTFDGYLDGWLKWRGSESVRSNLSGLDTIIDSATRKLEETLEMMNKSLSSTPDVIPASEKPGAP